MIQIIGHTVYYYKHLPILPQEVVHLKMLTNTYAMSWRLDAMFVLAGTDSGAYNEATFEGKC